MSYNKEVIIIDSDDERDNIKPIKINNSNNNSNKSLNQNNSNHNNNNNNNKTNAAVTNTNTYNNNKNNNNIKYTNNNNNNNNNSSSSSSNKNNSFNNHNNSRANFNNSNNNHSKNITKSKLPKYNSEQRRQFLAEIHEKRLGIGKSIQCIEIDDNFFNDDNDLNDINNKYTIKDEFNNNNNNNNNSNNKTTTNINTNQNNINNNKPLVNNSNNNNNNHHNSKSTVNNINNNNSHNNNHNNNNVNKQPQQSQQPQEFDYQASLKLRKEIESIRNSKHQSYRDNKLGQKKMYNLNDIDQLRKNEENDKMVMASMETTINSNKNSNIHTIDNTLLHPEAIGRKALELTNTFRRSKNLQPLIWNQSVYFIGVEHSKNMAEKLVEFGHDGFKERVKKFTFRFKSVGENVAYTNSSDVAENAVDGWINSPGHRKNLLGNFNVCSIGVYKNSEGFWYLTQLFALQST